MHLLKIASALLNVLPLKKSTIVSLHPVRMETAQVSQAAICVNAKKDLRENNANRVGMNY